MIAVFAHSSDILSYHNDLLYHITKDIPYLTNIVSAKSSSPDNYVFDDNYSVYGILSNLLMNDIPAYVNYISDDTLIDNISIDVKLSTLTFSCKTTKGKSYTLYKLFKKQKNQLLIPLNSIINCPAFESSVEDKLLDTVSFYGTQCSVQTYDFQNFIVLNLNAIPFSSLTFNCLLSPLFIDKDLKFLADFIKHSEYSSSLYDTNYSIDTISTIESYKLIYNKLYCINALLKGRK